MTPRRACLQVVEAAEDRRDAEVVTLNVTCEWGRSNSYVQWKGHWSHRKVALCAR